MIANLIWEWGVGSGSGGARWRVRHGPSRTTPHSPRFLSLTSILPPQPDPDAPEHDGRREHDEDGAPEVDVLHVGVVVLQQREQRAEQGSWGEGHRPRKRFRFRR